MLNFRGVPRMLVFLALLRRWNQVNIPRVILIMADVELFPINWQEKLGTPPTPKTTRNLQQIWEIYGNKVNYSWFGPAWYSPKPGRNSAKPTHPIRCEGYSHHVFLLGGRCRHLICNHWDCKIEFTISGLRGAIITRNWDCQNFGIPLPEICHWDCQNWISN
jgi:hypothetical protein